MKFTLLRTSEEYKEQVAFKQKVRERKCLQCNHDDLDIMWLYERKKPTVQVTCYKCNCRYEVEEE